MPLTKGEQEEYGKIIGHMINSGISPKTAKKKTEKAIKDKRKKRGMHE